MASDVDVRLEFSCALDHKGQYHEYVTNIRYAVVSLTTVRRERCFSLSERFVMFPLVTSRIWRERWGVTTGPFRDNAPDHAGGECVSRRRSRHISADCFFFNGHYRISCYLFRLRLIYI